ncbi:MAG: SusC/RagA family TonB-linked outer membrane protein [Mucilaginibacter sp.]|nr:SusC/RagA family TonB-linked outer membrane protein [Mucilaginibacter sp.]
MFLTDKSQSMIKNFTLFKSSGLLSKLWKLSFLALAPVFVFAQQPVKNTADSLSTDKMDRGLPYRERGVNVWNGVVPRQLNLGGTSTIYAEDINTTPVADISNVMAGRLAGLYTIQSSGRTGFDASIFGLRGQTPLIVIDGVIRNFTGFNPNDIKSITVMKDAVSTAMFGMRSSNGIIYITTKDRSESRPFELNFTAQYGALQHLKSPSFITGANYARLYNEAQLNTNPGSVPFYSDAAINAYQNGTNNPFLQPSTNWYNLVYKKNSAQQRYNVDVAGNGKSYRYFASIEHFNSDGNFVTDNINAYNTNNFYKRYNIRTNAQMDFSDDIQLTLNIFGSIENQNEPGIGASNIMNRIYATSPLAYPVLNADGSYGGSAQNTVTVNNVTYGTNILASTVRSGYLASNQRTLNADASLLFKLSDLTKGLWAKGTLSINNYYQQNIDRSKPFAVYNPTTVNENTIYTKVGSDGVLEAGKGVSSIASQFKQTYTNVLVGYDRDFNNHHLNLLATYNNDNTLNSYTQLNQIYQTAGLTARYNYKETYLAEFAGSYSSFNRYEPGKRWGFLPSLGLGWILSKEDWFKSDAISFLKLRASAGQTAYADPSNYYIYVQRYTLNSTGYNLGTGLTGVSGAFENALASTNLTWEKAWKYDAGIEAGFFDNRLNAVFTYYNNRYYDLLQQKNNGDASGILGQTYPLQNLGKNTFTGFEATLSFSSKPNSKFGYQVGANVSIEQSKVIDKDEPNYPYSWLYLAGAPVTQQRGYEAIGFYQAGEDISKIPGILGYNPQPGDIKYKDLNGDGIINFLDQKQISSSKPRIFFGLNFGLNYKNFDLNGLFQGITNRQLLLNASSMSAFSNGYGYVLDYTTENRWTPQSNVNATLPRLTLGANSNNQQASTFWLRDANYLRLKNLELGYSFPARLLSRAKINRLRLFVNAYNLFTLSQLKYVDPESGLSGFSDERIINGGISLKL